MSTETVRLLGMGAQDVHLDFHTAPELCSDNVRRFFHKCPHYLCHHTEHPNCLIRDGTNFLSGADMPHVYMRALMLCCFQSFSYPDLWEGANSTSRPMRRVKECPFCGVTNSGRVWRNVQSVLLYEKMPRAVGYGRPCTCAPSLSLL